MSAQHQHKKRFLLISRVTFVLTFLVLLAGVGLGLYQRHANQAAEKHAEEETQRANNGQPSTAPSTIRPDESEFNNYRVAANEPRYIFIPSIAVRAIVKPMGITPENEIQAPANVHHAGWFTGSAEPGEVGAMVVDGHVSNWRARSVFYELKKLKPGDKIAIERGDGHKINYAVVKSQSYDADKVDMAAALAPVNVAKPGLNLITCDGKITKGNEYTKRLVVFAEQL